MTYIKGKMWRLLTYRTIQIIVTVFNNRHIKTATTYMFFVVLHTLPLMQHCHSLLPEIDATTSSCNRSRTWRLGVVKLSQSPQPQVLVPRASWTPSPLNPLSLLLRWHLPHSLVPHSQTNLKNKGKKSEKQRLRRRRGGESDDCYVMMVKIVLKIDEDSTQLG